MHEFIFCICVTLDGFDSIDASDSSAVVDYFKRNFPVFFSTIIRNIPEAGKQERIYDNRM